MDDGVVQQVVFILVDGELDEFACLVGVSRYGNRAKQSQWNKRDMRRSARSASPRLFHMGSGVLRRRLNSEKRREYQKEAADSNTIHDKTLLFRERNRDEPCL